MSQDEQSNNADAAAEDLRFMRVALEEAAAAASEGEVPIGAAVVCDGRVVSRAWRLSGCTVYVTLEPCLMCAGLMVNARVDRCVYGAPDPKGGALGTLFDVSHDPRLNHAFEVTPGVLADEAAEQLRMFFRARRKSKG